MYLLDTNVVSELHRLDRADEHVRRWSQRIAVAALFLSAITSWKWESESASCGSSGVIDPRLRHLARGWRKIFVDFGEHVLPFDLVVARRCAGLHISGP